MPQVVLGAAFSWGIPMAWSAQGLAVPTESILMFFTSLLWIVAYDTLYAMVDRNDDLKVGIKSTAILFGDLDKVMIGVLQALTLTGLYLLGQRLGYEHAYYVGLASSAGLFVYQQWLIRDRERMGAFAAFRNNILVGASLLTFTLIELLLEKYRFSGHTLSLRDSADRIFYPRGATSRRCMPAHSLAHAGHGCANARHCITTLRPWRR